jgi:hypothetical protein
MSSTLRAAANTWQSASTSNSSCTLPLITARTRASVRVTPAPVAQRMRASPSGLAKPRGRGSTRAVLLLGQGPTSRACFELTPKLA